MIDRVDQLRFDYGVLDAPTRTFVQEKAQAIHARLKRTAEDIIAIGQDLIAVKKRLEHGNFKPWLQSEFGMSIDTAQDFMRVARRFGDKNWNFQHLPISVLYELSAPSTPDTIIQMVETGQIPATIPAIREAKREGQQESLTPQQFIAEVFPGFTKWQEDTVADVTPEPQSPIIQVDHESKERHDAHVMRVMGSSDSPEWYTPHEIIKRVITCFGEIDVDPCSNSHEEPAVPARTHYTREDNGLIYQWEGKVYLNPPYGDEIKTWVQNLVQQYEEEHTVTEAIALLPARIDTIWFQPLYAYPMCNVRGRLQFENSPYHAPFPCVIVYLGRTPGKFIATFKDLGPIMGRIG